MDLFENLRPMRPLISPISIPGYSSSKPGFLKFFDAVLSAKDAMRKHRLTDLAEFLEMNPSNFCISRKEMERALQDAEVLEMIICSDIIYSRFYLSEFATMLENNTSSFIVFLSYNEFNFNRFWEAYDSDEFILLCQDMIMKRCLNEATHILFYIEEVRVCLNNFWESEHLSQEVIDFMCAEHNILDLYDFAKSYA